VIMPASSASSLSPAGPGRTGAGGWGGSLAAGPTRAARAAPAIPADHERVRAALATALEEADRLDPDEIEGALQALACHGWAGLEADQGRRLTRRVKALIGVRLEGLE
jgi:hypothetical protein